MRTERGVGLALLALAVAAVLVVTITPGVGEVENAPLWCLRCVRAGGRAGSDFLLNVLLFVPVGVGLALAGVGRRVAVGMILVCTLGIETAQVSLVPGRFASLLDVAANGVGGYAGLVLGGAWRSILRPSPAVATRVLLGLGAAWLGTQAVTAWSLQPYPLPDAVRVRGVAAGPDLAGGGVLEARLGGRSLVSTRTATDSAAARRMGRIPFVLTLRLVPAGPGARPTRFRIVDEDDRTFLGLAQQGGDLRLRWRLRAREVGLRAPALFLEDAFPGLAAAASGAERGSAPPVTVRVGIGGSVLGLEAWDENGRPRRAGLRLTPNLTWSLLLGNLVRVNPVSTAAWIAAWMLALGYWLGHASPAHGGRGALRFGTAAVLLIGWVAIPWIAGTAVPAVWEWAVAAGAGAGGWYPARARGRAGRP